MPRGQLPIQKEDFEKIPDIVNTYDDVFYVGKDDTGNDLIRYKKIDNGYTYYVEAIRNKRYELMAKTMWKTRTHEQVLSSGDESPLLRPERFGSNLPPSKTKITKDSVAVKPSSKISIPASISELPSKERKITDALTKRGTVNIVSDAMAKQVLEQSGQQADGLIQGFVLNGKAYIVPENIESGKMWDVIRHEVGTHIGQMLHDDAEFNDLKETIAKRKEEQSSTGEAIRKAYERAEAADTKPEFMTEEVLGYLVEDAPNTSIARRIIALIKKYLQKMGIYINLSQADMVALADIAVRREANRRDKNRQQGQAKFAKAEAKPLNTDTPAFKKWFGDSKVVDKEGNPLVVYHGTGAVFSQFNINTTGTATDSGMLGKGFYFTNDSNYSNTYALRGETPNVIIVYISLQNPLILSDLKKLPQIPEPQTIEEMKKADILYSERLREQLISQGYDGVIYESQKGDKEIVAFYPEQIKSVFNQGTFDPKNPDIRFSIAPPAAQATPTRLEQRFQQDTTFMDSMKDLWNKAKNKDERELARDQLTAKTLDHLHFIQKRLGDKAYQMHRVLTGINTSQIAMFLEHGKFNLAANASNNNDVLVVTDKNKGFIPFLESIGDDFQNLFYYTAAKRSLQLRGQDRENWIPEEEAREFLNRVGDKAKNGERWEDLNKEFQGFNKNVLDVAEHAGLITADQRKEWESDYYLPFYRVLEDEQSKMEYLATPHSNHKHLSAQIRRLKGGEATIGNPLENILTNWMHLLNTAAENKARTEAFNVGSALEIIEEIPKEKLINMIGSQNVEKFAVMRQGNTKATAVFNTKEEATAYIADKTTPKNKYSIEKRKETIIKFGNMKDKGILSFQREGKPVYFKSSDADLFEALSGIDLKKFDNTIMKIMGASKRLLSYTATFGAGFKIRNMIRDTVHVAITSKSFIPVVDSAKGFLKAMRQDADYIEFMSTGFGFGSSYVESDTPEIGSKYIKKILKKEGEGAIDKIIRTPAKMLHLWEKIGAAGENAARIALYSNLKKKGATPLQAGFQARDLMDFSMRGGSTSVQMLTRTIPFLNARVQAFYKLGRAASEDPKTFAAKSAMLTFAGLALWSIFKDDDRYKELEDFDKWTYYHLWLGEGNEEHYRIPKPFEIGALFNSMPETMANVMNGNDDGKMVWDWFKFTAHDILRVDLPQLVKPIVEDKFNKSSFTGRDIIPDYIAKLPPEEQYNAWTPALARAMGDALGVAPLKVQHYIRGYFASIGMGTMIATDAVIRNIMNYPVAPAGTMTDYIPGLLSSEM